MSVANKFLLTKPTKNTDQFNGILYTGSYRSGMTVAAVKTCVTRIFAQSPDLPSAAGGTKRGPGI